MTWAAAWPRRVAASVLAGLLPLLGALTIIAAGPASGVADEVVTAGHHVDAIAPGRVVLVRQAVVAPPQLDRVDPPPAVLDSGPPRRAELPQPPAPAAPVGAGVNAVPVDVPDYRGPPPGSAP
ncbi:hypothetical protein ACFPM7_21620 [Actinokineospora guangxiensis]|uniref:Uncharacterized protein n=1 Tax=Actinokineospora guangxiensis TaxID=1490288 RepID=A0ABW0EQV6_9PSEU